MGDAMTTRHQAGYVFAANGAFHVRYYVTQVVDGQLRRVQKSGRLCSKSDGTKTAKRLAAAVMERVNAQSGRVEQVDVSVTEFWERTYLPHLERTTKPSTLNGYCKLWGQHLALQLSSFTLRTYRTVDATRFLTSLAERDLCTRTIAHVRSLLSGLFRHALRTGLIETNPVRDAGSLTPARTPEPTHAYTLDEAESIVSALIDNPQAQLIFALACFLGLRPGEIAGLQWSDFTGEVSSETWLHVRRSSWRGVVGTTKTPESVASLPVIEPVRQMLAAWKISAKNEWVFPSTRGDCPIDVSDYGKRVIRRLVEKHGIVWRGLYSGRRGAATVVTQLTGNALAAQVILRHKNLAVTTAHYVKPSREAAVNGLKLLEAKLMEKTEGEK
jgi:integrase